MKKLLYIILIGSSAMFAACEKEPSCNKVVKDLTTKKVSSNPDVFKYYVTVGPKRETAGVTNEISYDEYRMLRKGDPYCR